MSSLVCLTIIKILYFNLSLLHTAIQLSQAREVGMSCSYNYIYDQSHTMILDDGAMGGHEAICTTPEINVATHGLDLVYIKLFAFKIQNSIFASSLYFDAFPPQFT